MICGKLEQTPRARIENIHRFRNGKSIISCNVATLNVIREVESATVHTNFPTECIFIESCCYSVCENFLLLGMRMTKIQL